MGCSSLGQQPQGPGMGNPPCAPEQSGSHSLMRPLGKEQEHGGRKLKDRHQGTRMIA